MSQRKSKGERRMGRPRLLRSQLRRNRLMIHLTDGEMKRLVQLAQRRDIEVGALAREILVAAIGRRC